MVLQKEDAEQDLMIGTAIEVIVQTAVHMKWSSLQRSQKVLANETAARG
jgi:hypothetical protein